MVSSTGRLVICTGTGNNGNQPLHEGGILKQGQTRQIELSVSSREPTLNVQLWKSYEDEMSIYIENPSGNRIGPLDEKLGPQRYRLGNTDLLIYYGKPGPYHLTQEIYIDFIPEGNYVDSGVWKVLLSGKRVRSGQYFLWLPGGNVLNRGTGFYSPRAVGTLTIPSTAGKSYFLLELMIPDRMPTQIFPEGEVSSCRSGSLTSQLPVYPSPPRFPAEATPLSPEPPLRHPLSAEAQLCLWNGGS